MKRKNIDISTPIYKSVIAVEWLESSHLPERLGFKAWLNHKNLAHIADLVDDVPFFCSF